MRRRHPIPRVWMMTDERIGDELWDALARLPRGSGVVFRHHGLPEAERRGILRKVAKVTGRRRLVLLAAGGLEGRDGVHNGRRGRGLLSWSAHSRREAVAAVRAGAHLLFVSPVWPTRSHPGARSLGRVRLGLMIRNLPVPVIALGGMTSKRFKALKPLGVYGWAGIDAWLRCRGPRQT
ncbi:thiamine phosphate synthase [Sphingomonas sp. DT-204]|uniref:thiamine phosphate synthase n=1 Tax=Sphingomonas sp. DT-204 TaxID=3396166 RepID=UPI003F1C017C